MCKRSPLLLGIRLGFWGLISIFLLSVASGVDLPTLSEYTPPSRDVIFQEPLSITDKNDQEQLIVGIEEESMRLIYPNIPEAEIIVPLDDPGIFFSVTLNEDASRVRSYSSKGDYQSVIEAMNLIGPDLLRLADAPPQFSDIASLAGIYYRALAAAGPIDRALDLTLQMPMEQLPEAFHEVARLLVLRAIREGRGADVEPVLIQLRAVMNEDEFAEFAFTAADLLRTEDNLDLAAKIYGTIALSGDEELRQRSLLWAVYSYAVSGDTDGARSLLDDLEEPDWESPNFPQYCLARGRLAMLEGDASGALNYISRAMVLTSVDQSFKPELYYLLSQAYLQVGDEAAAQRLTREFGIFFPESPWLKRIRTATPEPLTETSG